MPQTEQIADRLPAPVGLRVNGMVDPIGIDAASRRLTWTLPWSEPGAAPAAVRVVLAADTEAPADSPFLLDTGRLSADRTQGGIAFVEAQARSSRERIAWRVMAWDRNGRASAWSDPAVYEMGLLADTDWQGHWIAAPGVPLPLLRCRFTADQPAAEIVRARFYGAGLGYFRAWLNGTRLGTAAREPEYTDYWKRILYRTCRAESCLRDGENVLGLALGHSWFERFAYGHSMARAQLELDYRDGSRQIAAVDYRQWRATPGPWRAADPYGGESYDARLDPDGWREPGFDDGDWGPVSMACGTPPAALCGTLCEPVRVTETRQPVARHEVRPGVTVVDFGQNLTGWVRLATEGPGGTRVRLRFAEVCDDKGDIFPASMRSAECTDRYTLKGGGRETWEPAFTHRGFRYVQVSAEPALPDTWELTARAAHTDLPRRGTFACSDDRLNRLHRAVDWTIRDNIFSVPTDCPQRNERQGWLGDGHLIAETTLHHFAPDAFYRKWLRDIFETQEPAGNRTSACAPPWYAAGRANRPHRGAEQSDLVWTAAATLVAWETYLYEADDDLLRTVAAPILDHARYLAQRDDFPLIDNVSIGDHLFVGWGETKDPTDFVLLGTAFALEQTRIAAETARLQGDRAAAARCDEWVRAYQTALAAEFCDSASGGFGSQTADALALQFDFTPDRVRTLATLVADLDRHDGHLATGIVGTRYLLEALSAAGRADVAWRAVTAGGYPGWMEMLANGATTITERWTYWGNWEMNSHNHPALGSVGAWLFRWPAGIRIDPAAPGYRRFLVDPYVPDTLDWVDTALDTARGRVAVRWERQGDSLELEVRVPPGAEAQVRVPGRDGPTVNLAAGTHRLQGNATRNATRPPDA